MIEKEERKEGRMEKGIPGRGDPRSALLNDLIKKRDEVERELNRLRGEQKDHNRTLSDYNSVEEFDRAEKEMLDQLHYSFLERKSRELERIEGHIKKILQDEKYGRCERCGRQISKERLTAVPEATHCVSCQRYLEKMESMADSNKREYLYRRDRIEWQDDDLEEEAEGKATIINPQIGSLSLEEFEELDLGDEDSKEPEKDDPKENVNLEE